MTRAARPTASLAPLLHDAGAAARVARLVYTAASHAGLTRRRSGSGFAYFDAHRRRIVDANAIARIRALAIPPAWKQVWISASPHSHIQATGRDARGRKQYKYHARFRALREAAKFEHILLFGEQLPRLRRLLRQDLARDGLEKSKVAAAVVELMQRTCVRVGNESYAIANHSYGLTTLRDRHATIRGPELRLKFKGKGAKVHEVALSDARLARIVRRCRDVPGQRLFQYQGSDGTYHPLDSSDVNDYLKSSTGAPFSAKDFRTWAATVLALHTLAASELPSSVAAGKRNVKQALMRVADELRNTVAICRKSYVHPAVLDQYTSGELHRAMRRALVRARRSPLRGLRLPESVTVHWLRALPRLPARIAAGR